MATERNGQDRRWLWVGAAVVLVAVFFLVRSLTRTKLQIRVAEAGHAVLSSTISTNGRVEPEERFTFPCPAATTIKTVTVQQGDQVPKGKLLVTLDDSDARARLASAESGVKAAEAALEAATHNGTLEQRQALDADLARNKLDLATAQRNLDALTKLSATGAASASEVASAREQVATAQAALDASQASAKGRYSSADVARAQAALEEAKANEAAAREVVAKSTIYAPIAGTVYDLDARPTEFSEQGKSLLSLADLHHERIRAYFDEPEIGRLAVGQPIDIKWDAKPGKIWHGHIERVPITVTTYTTRNVGEVLIAIDGDSDGLLPDTNVTVTDTTSSEGNALTIPREALYSEAGKPFVYKVVGSELKKWPVVTGTFNLTQVSILSGLSEGDQVATGTSTGQQLQTGVPVKVVE